MRAIITQKSEISLDLQQSVTFDVLADDGTVILSSQTVQASPSQVSQVIKDKLTAYQTEYELSQQLEVGAEIT